LLQLVIAEAIAANTVIQTNTFAVFKIDFFIFFLIVVILLLILLFGDANSVPTGCKENGFSFAEAQPVFAFPDAKVWQDSDS
jgi:hypothetical protein